MPNLLLWIWTWKMAIWIDMLAVSIPGRTDARPMNRNQWEKLGTLERGNLGYIPTYTTSSIIWTIKKWLYYGQNEG